MLNLIKIPKHQDPRSLATPEENSTGSAKSEIRSESQNPLAKILMLAKVSK